MIKEIKKVMLSLFATALLCSGVGVGSWVIYSYKGEGSVNNPSYNPDVQNTEPKYSFTFNPNGGTWKTGNSTEVRTVNEKYELNKFTTKTFADIPNGPSGTPYFKGWYYTDTNGKDALFDFENVDFNNMKFKNRPVIDLKAMYSSTRFFDATKVNISSNNVLAATANDQKGGVVRACLPSVVNEAITFYHDTRTTGEACVYSATDFVRNFVDTLNTEKYTSYTVKLTHDVVVGSGGKLYMGSVFGQTGFLGSSHTRIDLNGYNLTIKDGGLVEAYGTIVNSKSTGEIIVENGDLFTNFAINDFKGGGNTCTFYFNGIVPFYDFILPYVDVPVTVKQQMSS